MLGLTERPAGSTKISEGVLAVHERDAGQLQTNLTGTLTDLRLDVDRLSFTLNGSTMADSFVRVTAVNRCTLSARGGGRDSVAAMDAGSILLNRSERHEGESVVTVLWA